MQIGLMQRYAKNLASWGSLRDWSRENTILSKIQRTVSGEEHIGYVYDFIVLSCFVFIDKASQYWLVTAEDTETRPQKVYLFSAIVICLLIKDNAFSGNVWIMHNNYTWNAMINNASTIKCFSKVVKIPANSCERRTEYRAEFSNPFSHKKQNRELHELWHAYLLILSIFKQSLIKKLPRIYFEGTLFLFILCACLRILKIKTFFFNFGKSRKLLKPLLVFVYK